MFDQLENAKNTAPQDNLLDPQRARILVIENERPILTMIARTLSTAGYTNVQTMSDSTEALSQLNASPPDLLMLDLHMQSPDGFEILEHIRSHPELEKLPVLILTGDHSMDAKRRALMGYARDMLTKPFDPREVLIRVENLLRIKMQERQLLATMSQQEEDLKRTRRELNQTYVETITKLQAVADSRGKAAAHHHLRVAELAELIAQAMGMPRNTTVVLRHAAVLHDIGKVVASAERPDAHHATRGGEILGSARSPLLRAAQQIALGHHEHVDGTGAPQGLSGDQIPIFARIVAVANNFDHFTHPQDDAAALTREEALARIEEKSGTWFDASVVDALRKVVPNIHADLAGSYVQRFDLG